MPVRIGFLGVAHPHARSYANALSLRDDTSIAGVYDGHEDRSNAFSASTGAELKESVEHLLEGCDAVIVASENTNHAQFALEAAKAGRHILCEKPLVTSESDAEDLFKAVGDAKVILSTAFPCRFSPAYRRLRDRLSAGELGKVLAVCSTNRGTCPMGWFVEPQLSGGGAMIDHTVHVADLLIQMLGEVRSVFAMTGNGMYSQSWDDVAMLHLEFAEGVFATLDASWSRPPSYKTWGDVTLNVVGERGVIEVDMFGQGLDHYRNDGLRHGVLGWGSNLDGLLVADFIESVETKKPPEVSGHDGWKAAQVALAGYESVRTGEPVSLVSN